MFLETNAHDGCMHLSNTYAPKALEHQQCDACNLPTIRSRCSSHGLRGAYKVQPPHGQFLPRCVTIQEMGRAKGRYSNVVFQIFLDIATTEHALRTPVIMIRCQCYPEIEQRFQCGDVASSRAFTRSQDATFLWTHQFLKTVSPTLA